MCGVKVWNKSESKSMTFRLKTVKETMQLMQILGENGYRVVMSVPANEGEADGREED